MATAELGACEWFVYELRRSNLIDRGQLEQVVGDCLRQDPRVEPAGLAQHLIEKGVLTRFQAERVLANKAQGLVCKPYVLVDALGSGSMGTVYKAVSKTDRQTFAVKVLPRRSMWNVRLARRQVRQFGQFQHPSVVPFVDVGTSGGMHYLVWPYFEGEPLEAMVQRLGKLPYARVAQIGLQVAQALQACHAQNIIHGLLKPSNISIAPEGHAAVLDFGIGTLLSENEGESLVDTMSTANTLTSGLDCASPESILEPNNRTSAGDQYSLGCTLFYCLTGRFPFSEGSAVEKMMAHQFKDAQLVREIVPEVPEKLEAIVDRLMKKKAEDRFGDLDEVIDELQPLAGPMAPVAKPAARQALTALRDRTMRKANSMANGTVAPPSSAYPQASPYPAPTSSFSAGPRSDNREPHSGSAVPEPARTMPTRQQLHGHNGPTPSNYAAPPGFVGVAPGPASFSPVFFTVLGMGVMAVTYLALVVFKPF